MKTDRVLTMDEFLRESCVAIRHMAPPASNARHIPITAKGDIRPKSEAHGCRCDRWGHPCPGCVERHLQPEAELPISSPAKEMR